MHDDFFAERGWHDVATIGERLEDTLGDHFSQRLEQQLVADQRDAAADNNAARTQ
jgi:hypothetical protein